MLNSDTLKLIVSWFQAKIGLWVGLWGMVVCLGWLSWTHYQFAVEDSEPGSQVETTGLERCTRWPAESQLPRSSMRPTLLFFMHPKCPCTRASIHELKSLLERLTSTGTESPQIQILASCPSGPKEAWLDTDTIRSALRLPSSSFTIDDQGIEAKRFGVSISGTVILFDAQGNRLYSGGITASRGHEGDNAGVESLFEILSHRPIPKVVPLPALGCKLVLPDGQTRTSKDRCCSSNPLLQTIP